MSKDVTLLNSLIGYVRDVKPYHTKIKQFMSELFFDDSLTVNITDSFSMDVYHQNVWGRDDIGGYRLQRLCEGNSSDLEFRIPAAIWPRWSLNDKLNLGQTPPGDDPATLNLTDSNSNGVPDSEQPWAGSTSSSHFLGSDHVVGDPLTYRVPFHQGSRVYVDGVQKVFGTDYFVDRTRGFIRFAIAPGSTQHIEVQLFKVDRLFIAYNYPFDFDVDYDYDMYAYDLLTYDSLDPPGTPDADYFQLTVDHSSLTGFQPVVFHNAIPYSVPKATLTILGSGATVNGDVWKVTAIGPWRFKVQKNSTGTIWFVNFKEVFDNGEISFVIDRTWANYYFVPDVGSYETFNVLVSSLDNTDVLMNLSLATEHGVITDPVPSNHYPMEFIMDSFTITGPPAYFVDTFGIGKVKKISQTLPTGTGQYYAFVLNDIPLHNVYVELRIEQNGQLNPWLNATITDDMYLRVNYVSPASSRLIHNVSITGTSYVETQDVNELVIYHGRGVAPVSVDVQHNAVSLGLPVSSIPTYFEGTLLTPDSVGVDTQRVIVNLATAQTVSVTLTFP